VFPPLPASGASSAESKSTVPIQANITLWKINYGSLVEPPTLDKNDLLSFQAWKHKFRAWAGSVGIWKVIDSEPSKSVADARQYLVAFGYSPIQADAEFKDLNSRICNTLTIATQNVFGNTLLNGILSEQRQDPDLYFEDNSYFYWKKILDVFEKKSGMATIDILEKLINLSYKREDNPIQYLQRFESLVHQLNQLEAGKIASGESLSEGMKLALFIRSLPSSLDAMVQAILASNSSPTVLDVSKAMRRQYEASSHLRDSDSSSSTQSALATVDFKDLRKELKSRRKARRGQAADGKNPRTFPRSQSAGKESKQINFYFGEENLDSFFLLNNSFRDLLFIGDDEDLNSNSDSSDSESELACPAFSSHAAAKPFLSYVQASRGYDFILDTGATKHVVFNRDLIEDWRECEPFHLYTATGHHTVVRKQGKVRVNSYVVITNVCFIPRATHNLISLAVLLDSGAVVDRIDQHQIKISKTVGKTTAFLKFAREPGQGVWKCRVSERYHTASQGWSKGTYVTPDRDALRKPATGKSASGKAQSNPASTSGNKTTGSSSSSAAKPRAPPSVSSTSSTSPATAPNSSVAGTQPRTIPKKTPRPVCLAS